MNPQAPSLSGRVDISIPSFEEGLALFEHGPLEIEVTHHAFHRYNERAKLGHMSSEEALADMKEKFDDGEPREEGREQDPLVYWGDDRWTFVLTNQDNRRSDRWIMLTVYET
ncbi:MAG: hypothetical protein ABEN55_04150 [Bradymonadaceae bacterium]